jgi:hypothetical protein
MLSVKVEVKNFSLRIFTTDQNTLYIVVRILMNGAYGSPTYKLLTSPTRARRTYNSQLKLILSYRPYRDERLS